MGSSFLSGLASQTGSRRPICHCVSPDTSIIDNAAFGEYWECPPASTSPPITSFVDPIPVRTTEQYCDLLLTTISPRDSIYSREHSAQGFGSSERVSNL
jgi:hypothetical protein